MRRELPPEIARFYFDFDWDNRKVWALPTPTGEVLTESLAWQLQFPMWSSQPPEPLFDLRPIDVITGEIVHPIHLNRIQRADLTYPVDAMLFRNQIVLLDGFHRLARAIKEQRRAVCIRVHRENDIALILRTD